MMFAFNDLGHCYITDYFSYRINLLTDGKSYTNPGRPTRLGINIASKIPMVLSVLFKSIEPERTDFLLTLYFLGIRTDYFSYHQQRGLIFSRNVE